MNSWRDETAGRAKEWPMSELDIMSEDELKLLTSTVRTFVEREIVPHEEKLRRDGATGIPTDLRRTLQAKAKAAGLWCFSAPAEFGGAGLSPVQLVTVLEQAVRHTY